MIQTTPSEDASGFWYYIPTIVSMKQAGTNMFLRTTETARWTGTFDGTSTEVDRVVIHDFIDFLSPTGFWFVKGEISFEGCVDGKSGTMFMTFVGKKPDLFSDWAGTWVILSGTGELEALHGQGSWWGPGAPAPGFEGTIEYSGNIHFGA